MNIHQKKKVLFILMLILLLSASVFGSVFSKEVAVLIIIPSFFVWFVLYQKWWRCPHCKRSLGRLEYGVTHCKYCGKALSEK